MREELKVTCDVSSPFHCFVGVWKSVVTHPWHKSCEHHSPLNPTLSWNPFFKERWQKFQDFQFLKTWQDELDQGDDQGCFLLSPSPSMESCIYSWLCVGVEVLNQTWSDGERGGGRVQMWLWRVHERSGTPCQQPGSHYTSLLVSYLHINNDDWLFFIFIFLL